MSKQPLTASLRDVTLDAEEETPPMPQSEPNGPPVRAGKAALTLRIDPALHRELRTRAFNLDTTSQNIILNALLEYGLTTAVPDRRISSKKSR